MNEQIKQIAERLAGLRDALEITPEEMAGVCNLTPEQYMKLESGTVDISVSVLHQISQAYGVELTTLMFGDEPKMSISFYAAVCCSCIYALAHNCVLSNAVCTILYKFFSVLFQKFHCHFSVHLTVLLSLCLTSLLYASALKTYLSRR